MPEDELADQAYRLRLGYIQNDNAGMLTAVSTELSLSSIESLGKGDGVQW